MTTHRIEISRFCIHVNKFMLNYIPHKILSNRVQVTFNTTRSDSYHRFYVRFRLELWENWSKRAIFALEPSCLHVDNNMPRSVA